MEDCENPSLWALMFKNPGSLPKFVGKGFFSRKFQPKFIISDYETGFLTALKNLMPAVDHLGR